MKVMSGRQPTPAPVRLSDTRCLLTEEWQRMVRRRVDEFCGCARRRGADPTPPPKHPAAALAMPSPGAYRIGGAYCRPPWFHCALRPRLILIGDPMPTLRSNDSP